jgi:hypothetical protein
VLGKEHDTLTSMNNLALGLSQQGQYEEAEEMQRPLRPVKYHKNSRERLDISDRRGG